MHQLPGGAGEDIYQQTMPFGAEAAHFDADRVIFNMSSVSQEGWFYYADAYHPGWKAFVNNTQMSTQETADGFKAVPVGPQTRTVEFRFFDKTIFCLQYLLCLGALIGIGLLTVRVFI